MKKANKTKSKKQKLCPLVEVIPYSKINNRDVIIVRCEKGQENAALLNLHSSLITLIKEKDLRILAVTSDFSTKNLSLAIKNVSEFN